MASCKAEVGDQKVSWLRIDRASRSGGNAADDRNFPLWIERSWGWTDIIDVPFVGQRGGDLHHQGKIHRVDPKFAS